jgi:hypothetical protein
MLDERRVAAVATTFTLLFALLAALYLAGGSAPLRLPF